MSGKQDLFEAYLKRIGKKTGGLADYASAGGKNIKSALSIQGTKSYMPTLPVVTGGQPPVLSAEPLRFEKVNKEPEKAEPETKQPQMLTTEPEREGRGLRPEAYLVREQRGVRNEAYAPPEQREQRGLRDEAYQPKEEPILPAATRSLADIQAEIDKAEAEAKKVRYKQAANETIRKVEKLKEEYYYTKNAEAWEKLSDADKDLMLAAAAEWQQTKDANVQTAMQNAVAGAYGFANGTTLPAQAQMKEKARSAVKTDDFDGLFEYAKRIYNAEQQAKRTAEVTEWAKENPTGAFFAQAGTNLASGLGNLDVIGNGIRNFGAGVENYVPLDTSSPLWSAAHATSDLVSGGVQAVEERNEGKLLGKELGILGGQEIGSFLYQTGASGLNSIVNLGVAALTGGVAGLSGKAVSTLSSIAMGNQTVANTILSNKEQGMTDSDAVSLGIISGVVEAVTEKYSLDTLLSADATKLAGMVNKILKKPAANSVVKALVAEGSEETASYLLNAVADVLVRGDENDIRAEYDRYIDAGMTKGEALGRTVLGILGETSSNFLGGALTGLVMGGGKAAVDAAARKSEPKSTAGQTPVSAPQMPVNAAENVAVQDDGDKAETGKLPMLQADVATEYDEPPKFVANIEARAKAAAKEIGANRENTKYLRAAMRSAEEANMTPEMTIEFARYVAKQITPQTTSKESWEQLEPLRKYLKNTPLHIDAQTVSEIRNMGLTVSQFNVKYGTKLTTGDANASLDGDFAEWSALTNGLAKDSAHPFNALVDALVAMKEMRTGETDSEAFAHQVEKNAQIIASYLIDGNEVAKLLDARSLADFSDEELAAMEAEQIGYEAANAHKESVSAKKAAYVPEDVPTQQKSTESIKTDLTDAEKAEWGRPDKETHQRISVKQNEELAAQRVENDFDFEMEDLKTKSAWTAEDVAAAQNILTKIRDNWRNAPQGQTRALWRHQLDEWYDTVLEHKTTTAQALRQMQEYVLQTAADDPAIAETLIRKELEKVNSKGESEFGDNWKRIKLTADETANLAALQPGDQDGLNALIDKIGKRIQKEYPAKVWEKVTEFSHVSMLLNARTLIKNPLSNLLLAGVSRTSDRVSALAQAAIHAFDKDFEATQAFVISKKSRELAKDVWKNIGEVVAEQGQRYDRNKTENEISLLNYANKKEVFKKSGKLPMLGNFVGKTYGAIGTGLNKLSARIVGAELFTEMSAEKSALENTRQLTYGLLELGDRGFMRESFVSRLASYIEAKGITDIDNIPDEAYRLAIESAFMDTFKDDNRLSKAMVGIKNALNMVGAGELLMPFVKTPANVTMRTVDYSPAGLLYNTTRAIVAGVKAKKSGDINNAAKLSRMVDMVSKGLTGSALVGLGMVLAATGRISGGLPDDEDEAAFLQQAGWRPFSFVTKDGKYISFDWAQPAAMTLVLGASMYENWRKGNGKGLLETGKDLLVTYFDTIFEQSTLQEFENLFGGYGSTGENILDVMLNYPLRFISSGAYAATKATDNINRETYVKGGMEASIQTLINKMYAKIPGLSKKLPAKYDVWGNVSKRDETYGEAFFNAYFNPGTTTQYKDTAVNNEILRLYDATKNKAVFPMKPDRNATVKRNGKNETVALDNEQYSQISKETGTAAKALMEAAMKSHYYKGLSDEKKVDFLSDMWSLSKVVGKVNVLGNESTIITGAIENKEYEVYAQNGAAGVMRYYETKKDADTNKNGHVSQEELLIYLDGKNWSSAEKGNWLHTFVSGKESAPAAVANKYRENREEALASWYDYYSVLYNDALAYKEKQGNEDVSLGALRQRDLAEETLDGMKISDEQRAYYWDLISKEDSWQKRNPYD